MMVRCNKLLASPSARESKFPLIKAARGGKVCVCGGGNVKWAWHCMVCDVTVCVVRGDHLLRASERPTEEDWDRDWEGVRA